MSVKPVETPKHRVGAIKERKAIQKGAIKERKAIQMEEWPQVTINQKLQL